jgi:hypothetical protein
MNPHLQHRLLAQLQQVARPRHAPWDPLGLMGVRASIHEQLRALGPLEEHHFREGGESGTNLIRRLPGRNSALAPLLVAAHYDGPLHSIGADDNASGVAALLLPPLARAMGTWLPDVRLSDHSPFWDAGYNALMVTDTSFMRNPHEHQMSDTIDTLDLPFFCAVVNGLDGALAAL